MRCLSLEARNLQERYKLILDDFEGQIKSKNEEINQILEKEGKREEEVLILKKKGG